MERIIIQPESVRGLGNVAEQKEVDDFELYNCILSEDTDVINNVEFVTFVSESAAGELSVLSLSASSASISVGGTSTLTATLTDDEDSPISGATITFKEGSTTLGTDTTDSSGEATYTYTGAVTGSHNLSVLFAGDSTYAPSTASTSITVNKLSTSTALSSSGVNVQVGTNVTFTATVTSSSTPVEGLTVTFKDGTATLGTGTTNSSGVATYSTSSLSVATHSITAVTSENDTYSTSTSSAVSVTVYDHLYSLAFSQSSYTATGGSAEISCTLLDNNVPVEGATISVTGSDSSLYSGITNSSGIASVTVSNLSVDTTFTCSYGNVSDVCTVTVGPSYLFYDDCSSSSRLSEYGSSVSLTGSKSSTLTYDTSNNAYYFNRSTNGDYFTGFKLPITATDNVKITLKTKLSGTSAYCQFGIWMSESSSKFEFIRIRGDKVLDGFKNATYPSVFSEANVATFNDDYYYLEISYQGDTRVINVYNSNSQLIKTKTATFQSYSTPVFYIAHNNNSTGAYIKEIKVESL